MPGHLSSPDDHWAGLAATARMCSKEPALDVLWETLTDPSPLVRPKHASSMVYVPFSTQAGCHKFQSVFLPESADR